MDIDECATDNECDETTRATCTNTIGSYTCACNSGFTGTGTNCAKVSDHVIFSQLTQYDETYCTYISTTLTKMIIALYEFTTWELCLLGRTIHDAIINRKYYAVTHQSTD